MEDRRQRYIGIGLSVAVVFLLTLIMVKAQMRKGDEVLIYSDFATHSSWATGQLPEALQGVYDKFYAYPVWHFLVQLLNLLLPTGREWASALVTACFLGFTAAVLYEFLWRELKGQMDWKWMGLLDVGLMMLTAVYMPWFNRKLYLGQSSPTIWHNPTNMAVKPVVLVAFLYFVKIYQERKNEKTSAYVKLSLLLLFSCFVKPSFVQGFLPAVMVFLLVELIRTRGEIFSFCLKMAAVFVPSGIYFLFQIFSVFGEGVGREIGIAPFAVIRFDSHHPLLSILQTVVFPLFVLCCIGWKQICRDKPLLFAVVFYFVSLLEYVLLIEVTEPESGNFEWAVQLAMFVLFVLTAVRFYQKQGKKLWENLIGNGLLLYHVGSGIYYYLFLLVISPLQC